MHIQTHRDIVGDRPILIPIGVKGFVKIVGINKFTGRRRVLANWFPNKVLDTGRNYIGSNNGWMDYCQVGTDNTTPTAGDTGLIEWFAGTSTKYTDVNSAQPSSPYYGYRRITYRFAQGSTATNLSEVGVGWGLSAGANLFSRALIVDQFGSTTTVTPLADEILEVTYELRYYPPTSDVNGTIVLDGQTYDTVIRASEVNSTTWQCDFIGTMVGIYSNGTGDWSAWDGTLGTIIQAPNGSSQGIDNAANVSNVAYANNSYQRDMIANCGINGWNLGAGIRSIRIRTTAGSFQTQFSNQSGGTTIPKTVAQTLSLTWRIAWVEGVAA